MKYIKTLLTLIIAFTASNFIGQISVGPRHTGTASKFDKGFLEKVNNTKTIFLLSETYTIEEYEFILKNIWTVTEFEVMKLSDYDASKIKGNYNLIDLSGYQKTSDNGTFLYVYIRMVHHDNDGYDQALAAAKNKNKVRTDKYISNVSRIELFPNKEMRSMGLSGKEELQKFSYKMYHEPSFHNYSLGFLKNYLQKLNSILKEETVYWLYESDKSLPSIKNLQKETLYIPEYLIEHCETNEEELRSTSFKNYPYKIEVVSTDKIDEFIINEKEKYYLRYVQVGAQKFWQVVNTKSGEIVYRGYAGGINGLSRELKTKHINSLAKAVKK